jgi:hypothetical protein
MRSLLTITVLVLLSAAAASGRSRWRHIRDDDAFRCKIRACGNPSVIWPRRGHRWTRRRRWARWAGDVLIVQRGLFRAPVRLPARVSEDGVYHLPSWEPKRCGRRPIAVEITVSDGSQLVVAAPESARFALVGPYLAAAVENLPEPPVPGPHIRRQER